MANWKLYTQDAAHGRYGNASDTESSGTAQYACDANHATKWMPGDSESVWTMTLSGTPVVAAVGIGGHNLPGGASVIIRDPSDTALYTGTVICKHDFIVPITPVGLTAIKVDIGGATDGIEIGCISVLSDQGLTLAGVSANGNGYGIIEFSSGGPTYPVSMGMMGGYSVLETASGKVVQVLSGPRKTFALNLAYIKQTDSAGSYYRIEQSLYSRTGTTSCDNPGWYKGVWLTDDTYGVSGYGNRGYHCRPVDPGNIMSGSIVAAGGATQGIIYLEEFPDSV